MEHNTSSRKDGNGWSLYVREDKQHYRLILNQDQAGVAPVADAISSISGSE